MTTKPYRPKTAARPSAPATGPKPTFAEFPPRDDMQNPIYLADPAHQPALRRHFGSPETTIVLGEVPVAPRTTRRRRGVLIPDLLIAFNISRADVISSKGYSIEEQGKPPDFVLEVASPSTRRNDYGRKRIGYANFGVPEYWRFDPTGGTLYPVGLAGDALVDGEYVPITIHKVDDDRYWGHSEALNLDICWEYGELRCYDPVAQRYLLTYDATAEALADAQAQRADAEARANFAQAQRADAQARADDAEAEVRRLEAELKRLQDGS